MPTRSYAEIFQRHRGPYSLVCWRTFKNPAGQVVIEKKIVERVADPEDDARMLITDPRDCVTSIDVWSEHEQQFATTMRREDFGMAPISYVIDEPAKKTKQATSPLRGASGESGEAKPAAGSPALGEVPRKPVSKGEAAVSKAAAKQPKAKPTGGRSGLYVVADRKYDPGKGEKALAMWQAFLKMDGAFTAKQVAARFKSLDEKMVGPYASYFKKQGGLKAAQA